MNAETMDADFCRRRQELCLDLAAVVPKASALFLRLSSLAERYAEKAAAAQSNGGRQWAPAGSNREGPTST
jgi:hypothetical protein